MSPVYSRARIGYKISDTMQGSVLRCPLSPEEPSCLPIPSQNKSCSVEPTPWLAATLAQLAATAGIPYRGISDVTSLTGQLIEWQLGASAGSRPEQDFPDPVSSSRRSPSILEGRPPETTLSAAPLIGVSGAGRRRTCATSCRGCSGSWWKAAATSCRRPSRRHAAAMEPEEEEGLLRQDWGRADGHDSAGEVEQISARHGQVLQLCPKAANSRR